MRYAILIVQPLGNTQGGAYFELAEWLCSALRRLDQDVVIASRPISDRRSIVIGWNYLPQGVQLRGDSVLFNTEQLYEGSPWVSPFMLSLFWRFEVWDYSPENTANHSRLRLPEIKFIQLGHAPELERIAPQPEEIDVLFYGSLTERRRVMLERLRLAGLDVVHLQDVFGRKRDEYIARSRVVLNMHAREGQAFECLRVAYLLNNRRCVVSERGIDDAVEREFERGIAFAQYGEIVPTCLSMIARPKERERVANTGYLTLAKRPLVSLANAISVDAPTSIERRKRRLAQGGSDVNESR